MTPKQKRTHIEVVKLWFEFLKRSDYSSASPPYKDFGDVKDVEFEEWWEPRRFLFVDFPKRAVWRYMEHEPDLGEDEVDESDDGRLIVEVDLEAPEAMIHKQFRWMVQWAKATRDKRRKRGRPKKTQPLRRAPYSFYRQPNIRSLQTALDVHDLREAEPNLKLWEIGERLKLLPKQITRQSDTPAVRSNKRAVMTAATSRYWKWAQTLKANAAKGVFPKT